MSNFLNNTKNLQTILTTLTECRNEVLDIEHGGTGATTAEEARAALGLTPENIGAVSTDTVAMDKLAEVNVTANTSEITIALGGFDLSKYTQLRIFVIHVGTGKGRYNGKLVFDGLGCQMNVGYYQQDAIASAEIFVTNFGNDRVFIFATNGYGYDGSSTTNYNDTILTPVSGSISDLDALRFTSTEAYWGAGTRIGVYGIK